MENTLLCPVRLRICGLRGNFIVIGMLTYYISGLHRQPLRGNDRRFALLGN